MNTALAFKSSTHVVDILGNVAGRDQPIMLTAKAIELVSTLDPEVFQNDDVVFFDPFCKAGEILLACAILRCRARFESSNSFEGFDPLDQETREAVKDELYRSNRYFAMAPDERHYRLSLRTFLGNENSHDPAFNHIIRNGNYLSEIEGRLDRNKFESEFLSMLEYIKSTAGGKKIVAVGNPPYQEDYKGNNSNTGANPIYHLFLNSLMDNEQIEQFLMVIPSRWFSGGRGKSLKEFASRIRSSQQVKMIYDFEDSKEVFPTVEIKGGICFLHWSSNYEGKTLFYNNKKKEKDLVDLSESNIVVREKTSRTIIKKVNEKSKQYISDIAWSWNPFSLPSNYFDRNQECQEGELLECYTKRKIIKIISKSKINKNSNEIGSYKVAYPKAVKKGGVPYDQGQLFIIGKDQVCTETYMIVDSFSTLREAENLISYLQTDFVRYLLSVKKITQDITKETWTLVPHMDTYGDWVDDDLYTFFKLDNNEVTYIKTKVKEWS